MRLRVMASCVPDAKGSAATVFAPEPNGEAAAPPQGGNSVGALDVLAGT
jgi:hypothetical protein